MKRELYIIIKFGNHLFKTALTEHSTVATKIHAQNKIHWISAQNTCAKKHAVAFQMIQSPNKQDIK